MPQSNEDWVWNGESIFVGPVSLPAATVDDDAVSAAAAIAASKLKHSDDFTTELIAPASNVAAISRDLAVCRGAGLILGADLIIYGAMTGDRTVVIDIQKSTAGGAFATILTGTLTLNSSTVVRTLNAVTIASNTVVAGDILRAVVTLGGSTGTLATGLTVRTKVDQAY